MESSAVWMQGGFPTSSMERRILCWARNSGVAAVGVVGSSSMPSGGMLSISRVKARSLPIGHP